MSEEDPFVELIRLVREGDETAAAELVRRYEPAIRRVVRVHLRDRRLRRLLDSTDICQSVLATFFVRAHLGQYDLDSPESRVQLLATIARHKVTNQAHKQQAERRDYRREHVLGDRDFQVVAAQSDPSAQASAREMLAKVRDLLSEEERRLAEARGRGD